MPDGGAGLDNQTGVAQDRLNRLAADAATMSYAAVPALVRERVRDLVVDTLAVTAWGSRRAELAALRRVCTRGVRPAQRFLARRMPFRHRSPARSTARRPPPTSSRTATRRHVAIPRSRGPRYLRAGGGQRLLDRVDALRRPRGYEVGARIGIAMGGTPQGVHDIGTWGAVATAVATTHLLTDADAAAIARAIELAASSLLLSDAHHLQWPHGRPRLPRRFDQPRHVVGTGRSAGLAAAPGALERFLALRGSALGRPAARQPRPRRPRGWHDYEILRGYIKLHPACAHLHGVLDALDDIRATHVRVPDAALPDAALPTSGSACGPTPQPVPSTRRPGTSSKPASASPRPSPCRSCMAASTMTSSRTRRWPASRCASWPRRSTSSTHQTSTPDTRPDGQPPSRSCSPTAEH